MIIDSHAHVYSEQYFSEEDVVVSNAVKAGVGKIILPNVDRESLGKSVSLSKKYPDILYSATGLHPTEVTQNWRDDINFMEDNWALYEWIAIGETGLDYYWAKDFIQEQKECFEYQLRWSIDKRLPVIIHSRDAIQDTIDCINKVEKEEGCKTFGVFHSFTSTQEDMMKVLSLETYMIGINGVVTFKNSNLRNFIKKCPLDRLLIETDAPYLAPVPYRGKRNEPSLIVNVAKELANSYGISVDEIYARTTLNAKKLFNI